MTTYVPTPTETGEAIHEAVETAREQAPATEAKRAPRRGAFVFVSGFVLGAVTTTIASIVRRRQTPFVKGNRNVFVSLPFSGISMVAPAARGRNRGRQQRRFTRWSRGMARSMARGAARGAASGVAQGVARERNKKRAK